ncbi:hypothetical protein [Paenibacillus xanthanilyticus]|uniref:Uncharacterized protein n=1 Tax=Paenibacillus xanthanilyticus TaxID=1783531 RepID=A0ABV8K2Z0_9BACL
MKRKLWAVVVIIPLTIAIWSGVDQLQSKADGNSATPGSVEDPVVTKSYVDQKLAELGGSIKPTTPEKDEPSQAGTALEIVTVPVGKVLVAGAGAEVILRNGKAAAYSTDANGISDVTDGVDIANGKSVPANHLVIFPRAGRGIMHAADSKGTLTVMVRGNYEVKDLPTQN